MGHQSKQGELGDGIHSPNQHQSSSSQKVALTVRQSASGRQWTGGLGPGGLGECEGQKGQSCAGLR